MPSLQHGRNLPEPVYEAEVVVTNPGSATPPAFNPYEDLDDGTPYAVVDQAPAAEDFSVARQPCPACGEMIVATAARCRFCGEVFGPVAPKPKSKKSKKKSRAAAAGGGSKTGLGELLGGLACFGLGTALTVGGYMRAAGNPNGGRYFVYYGLIVGGLIGIFRGIGNMASSNR